ncbi:MAG: hypothetical protein RQ729_02770 [Wenzhouxiangellaceae bacterium]|nr:hypothetical protein [Wenzhouxiangellaceae bacterium]
MTKRMLAKWMVLAALASPAVVLAESPDQKLELPEPVRDLVEAMADVRQVEKLENGRYRVERRMQVTGSRLLRTVEMTVDEHGNVVDWGATPHATRNYTLEQLRTTGQSDLATALSQLDPRIRTDG